jgi:hypothetical protein
VSDRGAVTICATCGVEHARPQGVCAICADERQYLPPGGQRWVTFAELDRAGHRAHARELEPGLLAITVAPRVGIGH